MKNRRNGGRNPVSPALLRLAVMGFAVLSLGACEGVREELGLNKRAPDEFAVVAKAPLVLPPDFKLRPPQPGARRPQESSPRERAQRLLTRRAPLDATDLSPGEAALLKIAGAEQADPRIRRILDEETSLLIKEDRSFADRLIFWQKQPPFGTVVDAAKEKKRLQENAATGAPVTKGETPYIKRRKRAIFEGLFN